MYVLCHELALVYHFIIRITFTFGAKMADYDKEFLDYMERKYKINLEKATHGSEREIITFAVAWDVWKQAKKTYSKAK